MSRTHSPARQARRSLFFLAVLLFTSVYLAVSSRIPSPPRLQIQAGFFLANLVVHLLQGLAATVLLVRFASAWLKSISQTKGPARVAGYIAILSSAVTLGAGITLVFTGNTRPFERIFLAHSWGAFIAAISGAIWLLAKSTEYRIPSANSAEYPEASTEAGALLHAQHSTLNTSRVSRSAAGLIAVAGVSAFALILVASNLQASEGRINNATIMPASMEGEGDGPNGVFWPSAIQKVDKGFFPPEYFTDNKTCGEAGCHPDIYKQWYSSSHHFASFNNQWYRKSIEYMQEVVGTKPSKWCGGCHDMAILLTEKPGTGKSRFEFPIKDQVFPPEEHPEAHSGIGCAACHSTVHTKSTMGNGDYTLDYPPMHKYMVSANPFLKATTKFLTRLAPDPHRKTFLKPFHRQDTAKFCSSCHKVHLDIPVNNFRWFRGFNDYDAWQASGVSGQGARSFYYPKTDDGKPDFKKCADCHMKLEKSDDAGNISGKVHSHRFIAANTALPYVNHDTEQLMLTQKFLKDGALSIDIFALRRETSPNPLLRKEGAKKLPLLAKGTPAAKLPPLAKGRVGVGSNTQNAPEGQSASLFGEAATTGNVGGLMAASSGPLNETIVAPINRGAVAVERGKDALIDVVVRTRKVGHAFPGGTFDAFDVWVELQAKDETGKSLFWSGSLEWPDGPIEPSAHQYQAVLVDGHSRLINKRNAWAARARIYARAIPPGAADTIHYRLHIPKDCGKKITLTAKLNYRKFSWWNTQFAFRGRPETGDPDYSRKGFIEGTGVGVEATFKSKTAGPVTANYDDRPMRFDGDLKVVAAKAKETPNLPITTLCENTATLDVVDRDPEKATEPRKLDPKIDRERWNDYGIGSMLQGDFARATSAFKKVAEVAPGWPEGYVNIGRVRLQEGDLTESGDMFEKALGIYATVLGSSSAALTLNPSRNTGRGEKAPPPVPPAMAPYLKARTQFFYGMVLKNRGQYDEALKVWQEAARIFPDDRELRNQMGRVHFLFAATDPSHFDQAIKEFEHVLTIDPEDLTAHYNLMLCYKGKGGGFEKREELHRTLYFRFKNDETTTHLQGPYKIAHPFENNESIQIHEHTTAPPPRTPEMVLGPSARKEALKPIRKAETPPGRPKG